MTILCVSGLRGQQGPLRGPLTPRRRPRQVTGLQPRPPNHGAPLSPRSVRRSSLSRSGAPPPPPFLPLVPSRSGCRSLCPQELMRQSCALITIERGGPWPRHSRAAAAHPATRGAGATAVICRLAGTFLVSKGPATIQSTDNGGGAFHGRHHVCSRIGIHAACSASRCAASGFGSACHGRAVGYMVNML